MPAIGPHDHVDIGQPTIAHRAVPTVQMGQLAVANSRGWCRALAGGTPDMPVPDAVRRRHARTKRYPTMAMPAITNTMTNAPGRAVASCPSSVLHVTRAGRDIRRGSDVASRPTCTTLRHDRHRVAVVASVSKVVSQRGHSMAVMDPASLRR